MSRALNAKKKHTTNETRNKTTLLDDQHSIQCESQTLFFYHSIRVFLMNFFSIVYLCALSLLMFPFRTKNIKCISPKIRSQSNKKKYCHLKIIYRVDKNKHQLQKQ